ncbi:MAG: UDP-N-acetylmuramoyl-L-alanyl-D-glutamate--2,6-diaminopimelate ligase [Chitinivibrionales bacterium]|nr:UDP-N-acetylmuramoyl-L-alanyl-D-glutamate--2,6-diaminopimelate ligase [Chitinivibrionales bacterium]
MLWNELIENVAIVKRGGSPDDPPVTDVVYDSRTVKPGAVFVAITGFANDGNRFINDAIAQGAVAVVSQQELQQQHFPWIQVTDCRTMVAQLGCKLWNISCDPLMMVAVTGTNGKTTTATLFHNFFNTILPAHKAWLYSTIVYKLGEKILDAGRTTPEAVDVYRAIAAASDKPQAIVMEVSSHSLALRRVEGFHYDLVVWTNLTQDHLDFHTTMDAYYEAKRKLFFEHLKSTGAAVINIDDPWGRKLLRQLPATVQRLSYGSTEDADVRIIGSSCMIDHIDVTLQYRDQQMLFHSCLTGDFNVYNVTAFITGCWAKGYATEAIAASLAVMQPVAGRMERVCTGAGFAIFVDYAHTPDALVNILTTVRKLTKRNLVCVFGCGGNRDKTKRPLMAQAVSQLCDEAIVTSDNPRMEKPFTIIQDIVAGMPLDFPHTVIEDRREAIKKALLIGQPGDCIVIAGKGHETYQEIGTKRHHFDDREVVEQLCRELEITCGK